MIRNLIRSVYLRFRGSPMDQSSYTMRSVPQTFRRIYSSKAWGDNGEPFYSGPGSRGPASDLYVAAVARFLHDHNVGSVVDFGCGDFSVGRKIVAASGVRYTGIDVVPELIQYHQANELDPRVSFQCADITRDPLPAAELCLIRQVLQHLTNREIAKILKRLGSFPRVLITEDIPLTPTSFNHDMTHGPEVRSDFCSGVFVDQPPFSVPATELWSFPLTPTTRLRTVLLDRTGSASASTSAPDA